MEGAFWKMLVYLNKYLNIFKLFIHYIYKHETAKVISSTHLHITK